MSSARSSGSIVCVGVGMTLGSHISPLARSHIELADSVFCSVSDATVELWVKQMNPRFTDLQQFYGEGKDRRQTYQQMVDAMMQDVRKGLKVVGVFYGHPGVFAKAPHDVIQVARDEGFVARMEPGISAEDCLYADIGIDPGRVGCQHLEASQFMLYQRQLDTAGYVVLWQIGLAGDIEAKQFTTSNRYRQLLVDRLLTDYPADHRIAIYEAPTLPIHQPRIDWLELNQLAEADVYQHSTLLIPPAKALKPDQQMRDKIATLRKLEASSNK